MKKKALPVLALTLIMLLCAACGSRQFTVIDGDSCREVTLAAGESIAGPALIYTLDGDVFYAEDYRPDRELTGAILDPPGLTQMDVYELTKKVFDKEGRALLIYKEGCGRRRPTRIIDPFCSTGGGHVSDHHSGQLRGHGHRPAAGCKRSQCPWHT